MLLDEETFRRFAPSIMRLREPLPPRGDPLVEALLLEEWANVRVYYAPIGYVNPTAKILVVGITPGWAQMEICCLTAAEALRNGASPEDACRLAKYSASFAGAMRRNLVSMLDQLGVAASFPINSTDDLFSEHQAQLDTASILPYPVLVDGRNYTGHRPDLEKDSHLWSYVERFFRPQLMAHPDALVVPLGDTVARAVERLGAGLDHASRYFLNGFPHPSGANGHRKSHFAARYDELCGIVKKWSETRSKT